MLNPYELLGVTVNSSVAEVRRAYYGLALLCHPDRTREDTGAEMAAVHAAYLYVLDQVSGVRSGVTVEGLEAEFAEFCAAQDQEPPPTFGDLHNDVFGDGAWGASTSEEERWSAAEAGGYGDVMDASDFVVANSSPPVRADPSALSSQGHVFKGAITQYSAPAATCVTGVWHSYEASEAPRDFSVTVGDLVLSDYRLAHTAVDPAPDRAPPGGLPGDAELAALIAERRIMDLAATAAGAEARQVQLGLVGLARPRQPPAP